MRHHRLRTALPMLAVLLSASGLAAQETPLTDPARWTFGPANSGGAIVTEGAEPVLRLPGGFANLGGLTFADGTIAFEVRLPKHASFVGFRIRDGGREAEHIYFRVHKSGEWDAIQYQPIQNGSSTWQLHGGPGYTAAATLPAGEWIPIRLDVRGTDAELWVGAATEPAMRFTLEQGLTTGGISFNAGFRGAPSEPMIAGSFRRLRIESRPASTTASAARMIPTDDTFIRAWRVSEPMAVASLPVTTIPTVAGAARSITAEPRGLVNLSRHFSRVQGAERSGVVAEAVINADRAQRLPMAFEYSDDVSIFLNGTLLFSGVNGWESRYGFYLGQVDPTNPTQSVWLTLRQGANRLTFVVTEASFGWGFFATLPRTGGVTVAAR